VLSELQRLLFDQNLDRSSIGAVGLAVPGPLSYTQGSTSDNVHYETVRDLLSRELNCQILMDSNTNMAALAESRRGAVRDSEEALVVRLGHEVRSALIIDHKLLKGAGGRAGELGHVRVPGVVRKCKCGALGCINAVAASDAIVSACRAKGAEVEDIDDVIWAALHGDKCCQHALLEAGQAVGFGIASCINILAPPDVIVTGRLVAAGNILINPLREAVNKYVAKDNLRNCKLLFDAAHSHSEAIGASLAALLHIDFVPNLVSDVGPKVTEEA
jgi:predicted NBD/HSP70 family sugar kinase